jgi:hypothetical protein
MLVVCLNSVTWPDDAELEFPFSGNAERDLEEISKTSQGVLKVLRPYNLLTALIFLHVAYTVYLIICP